MHSYLVETLGFRNAHALFFILFYKNTKYLDNLTKSLDRETFLFKLCKNIFVYFVFQNKRVLLSLSAIKIYKELKKKSRLIFSDLTVKK